MAGRTGNHFITSAVEHASIMRPLRILRTREAKVTVLPVDRCGRVDAEAVRAAITGSACHAGCVTMSSVLIAMGATLEVGMGTIRFSLSDDNTTERIDRVVAALEEALSRRP